MGVEHYMVCMQCKEYIDLHKRYFFSGLIQAERPPFDTEKIEGWGLNYYWDARAIWFLWQHRGHAGVDMDYDTNDSWFDLKPYLKEMFPHNEDIKMRERKKEAP
jgi:hypothetical protein